MTSQHTWNFSRLLALICVHLTLISKKKRKNPREPRRSQHPFQSGGSLFANVREKVLWCMMVYFRSLESSTTIRWQSSTVARSLYSFSRETIIIIRLHWHCKLQICSWCHLRFTQSHTSHQLSFYVWQYIIIMYSWKVLFCVLQHTFFFLKCFGVLKSKRRLTRPSNVLEFLI